MLVLDKMTRFLCYQTLLPYLNDVIILYIILMLIFVSVTIL